MVVDDHKMIRDGIKSSLSDVEGLEIVNEASDGAEAIDKLTAEQVDVVLMDISMSGMGGIEATKKITETFAEVKVLALTMHDEESHIMNMLQAGALGYILKSTGMTELVEAVKTVANGESFFSQKVSATLLGQFVKNKAATKKEDDKTDASLAQLTKREHEILKLIAEEFTNQEIADKLFISQRTVDTHRRNLIQKLNAKNTAGLVRYAFRNGLVE